MRAAARGAAISSYGVVMARPTIYSDGLATDICTRLSIGESLQDITPMWSEDRKRGVYVLLSEGEPFYVGQTTNAHRRRGQHIQPHYYLKRKTNRDRAVHERVQDGRPISLFVIDDSDDLDSCEAAWIHALSAAGFKLANMADPLSPRKHLDAGKSRMPWHPHQAPMQKALIAARKVAKASENSELTAKVNEAQKANARLRKSPADWIAANLLFVMRHPTTKTWEGRIRVGGSYYG